MAISGAAAACCLRTSPEYIKSIPRAGDGVMFTRTRGAVDVMMDVMMRAGAWSC